jgi:hypothetical protein
MENFLAVVLGGSVLEEREHEVIVRVMYLTNHIPPDRMWFAVPDSGAAPEKLSFEQVRHLETAPYR